MTGGQNRLASALLRSDRAGTGAMLRCQRKPLKQQAEQCLSFSASPTQASKLAGHKQEQAVSEQACGARLLEHARSWLDQVLAICQREGACGDWWLCCYLFIVASCKRPTCPTVGVSVPVRTCVLVLAPFSRSQSNNDTTVPKAGSRRSDSMLAGRCEQELVSSLCLTRAV